MRWRNYLRNMFGLDWRSLALLRIGLALVLLADLAISAHDLRALYSDAGVLPIALVRQYFPTHFRLYFWNGSVGYAAALFALEAAFEVMLLIGYRTRLATIVCWFLLLSRQARNPAALFGADMIERLAIFWAMFLPLNRRFSLDAWLGRAPATEGSRYLGLAGFGAILQFICIYVVGALQKTGATWQTDHTAVYYALSMQIYARPLGQWLNQHDGLTAALTVFTYYLELYGPVLFVLPIWNGGGRLLGCTLFIALQVGFGTTMQMGLFWQAMIAFTLVLLPEEFWTWVAEPLARRLGRQPPTPRDISAAPTASTATWRQRTARAGCIGINTFVAASIVYTLVLNYDTLRAVHGRERFLVEFWRWPAADTGLEQNFNMFAPDPDPDDGWYVLRGWTAQGVAFDLQTGASPPSLTPPASLVDSYGDQRWCSYLLDLADDAYEPLRKAYADFLAKNWRLTHPTDQQLAQLDIIYVHHVRGPNHTIADPDPQILYSAQY